ncbi:MAG: carboxypeptidase-like regulatory domain-containing protein, partial [Tannerella sp.]|nr:carboxypeptidase-like regulatory domain-containing protein [Tannerella sp.]
MSTLKKIIFIICVFCTAYFPVFAQSISVSGTITDEAGEPLPGVSIVVKGTGTGIMSNANGAYQITVPNAETVLQFSYIGYSTVERTVGSQRVINVTMREDVSTLEEVVVIGYGTQKKASVTSAIVSVQTDELLKSPTTSLGNALAGRLPGLSAIQYSGLPGFDDPTIYIRGVSTTQSSSPLILVDG